MPAPPLAGAFPEIGDLLHPPGPTGRRAVENLRRGIVEHLNEAAEIGREYPDWHLGPTTSGRLWTVTLHYGAWAHALADEAGGNEEAAELLVHYLDDWLRRCGPETPGARHLAWNAYAVATRLTWWTLVHRTAAEALRRRPGLEERFLASLARQAEFLARHLEWDLRGNHLVRDAVGLACVGRFFAGPRADTWLETATALAVSQAREQVLADGGHFELSPAYHAVVLADFSLMARLVRDEPARETLCRTCDAMGEHLVWMRHGDGGVALLNDGGLGTVAAAEPPPRGMRHFADSGRVVFHGDPWSVFFDVGAVGPDVQPGHGHADTLAIEASYRGRRLFVDAGSFGYDPDERRRYDRSTAAHNTVTVDGEDSSELWHVFRLGRRARVRDVEVDAAHAAAGHDGYRHLPGRPRVWRELGLDGAVLTLRDRVEGGGRHRLEGGLLVEPGWGIEEAEDGWWLRQGADRLRVVIEGPPDLKLAVVRRPYHPDYGVELEACRICWSWEGRLPLAVRTVVSP